MRCNCTKNYVLRMQVDNAALTERVQELSNQLPIVKVETVRSALSHSSSDESPVVSSDEDNGSHRD